MTNETAHKCKCGNAGASISSLWCIGWLFTIGFIHLTFWKAVLALIIWPYMLGASLR